MSRTNYLSERKKQKNKEKIGRSTTIGRVSSRIVTALLNTEQNHAQVTLPNAEAQDKYSTLDALPKAVQETTTHVVKNNDKDETGFICGHYYYIQDVADFSGLPGWFGHEFARLANKQKPPSLRFVAELQYKSNLILFYVEQKKLKMINWECLPPGVIAGKWSWQSKWCFTSVVAGELRTARNMRHSTYRKIFKFVTGNKDQLPIVSPASDNDDETEPASHDDSKIVQDNVMKPKHLI